MSPETVFEVTCAGCGKVLEPFQVPKEYREACSACDGKGVVYGKDGDCNTCLCDGGIAIRKIEDPDAPWICSGDCALAYALKHGPYTPDELRKKDVIP